VLLHFLLPYLFLLSFAEIEIFSVPNVEMETEEEVIFYTSYGYLDDEEWVIPLRIYVQENRSRVANLSLRVVNRIRGLNEEESALFSYRISDFVADSESRETVKFIFDNDPDRQTFYLNEDGSPVETNLNGFKVGEIRLSIEKADVLLKKQNSENGWLVFRAVSDEHSGIGRVRLIEQEGLSVISDIDDTVKISQIPAGSRVVIRNTFFKEYKPAPRMANLYSNWDNAAFHYVSGSPWQLYRPLKNFLFSDNAGFPEGSMHMKQVTKNLLSINTWRGLNDLITNENVTYNQKIDQISRIFQHFPDREFILVGDSGERDPEVYREIARRYPDQISNIIIRDVINDRENRPDRLEGMEIIPAPTIQPGVFNP